MLRPINEAEASAGARSGGSLLLPQLASNILATTSKYYFRAQYIPVWLGNLSRLRVVLQVGDKVLKHLAPGPLLHPRELRGRVARSLTVDYLRQDPIPKHWTLL